MKVADVLNMLFPFLFLMKILVKSFFLLQGFSFTDTDNSRTAREGRGAPYHSTTSTRSRTFRYLLATLHVRWSSHTFNRIACIFQTATRWDVLPYRITIWLINDVTLSFFVCLRDDLFLAFFVTAIWDGKPVDSNSHRLSPLYYKRTD